MKTPQPCRLTSLILVAGLLVASTGLAADLLVGPGQTYTTIQSAVDAAVSGDNIIVEAGTYVEQVLIDAKDLTVTGAGAGLTTIEAPATLQVFYNNVVDHYPVLGVRDATVDLADFSLDGAGMGNLHERFFGVLYRNAGGSVTDVDITGVRNEPLDATAHGVGLALDNDDTTARSLEVTGILVEDYQKNAVAVATTAGTALTLTLTGNETVGAGPTAVVVQNGIEVSGADITVALDTNTVRDVAWQGLDNTATGILLQSCTGTVSGNILSGCQSGLHLNAAAVTASGNQITVPRPTDFGFGVLVDNSDPGYSKGLVAPLPEPSPYATEWSRRTAKATLTMAVTGNTITLDPAIDDATGTIGIRAENREGYDDLDVTVTGNTLTGFELATVAAETVPTTGVWLAADYGDNTFAACGTGLLSDLSIQVVAELCWWAAVDGPGGDGPGSGSLVVGDVDFDPWVSDHDNFFCVPATLQLTEITTSAATVFDYTGGASGRINGYSIDVIWDPAVAAATSADFTRPATGAFATADIFLVQDIAPGQVRLDAALGSAAPGIYQDPLFAATFGFLPAAADGAETSITVTVNNIRDHFNQDLAGLDHVPGLVQVDSKPVMQNIVITDTTLASIEWTRDGHDITVAATVVESSLDLLSCDLTTFGGPVLELADAAVDGNTYTWTFSGTSGTGDGLVAATVTGTDTQGATAADDGTITADNTAPAALAALTAAPGHQKIHLSWPEPAPDAGSPMAGTEFRYVTWGGYPAYSGVLPAPPADINDGTDTGAGLQPGTSLEWAVAPRDVYVVAGFVRDFAGNASTAPADAAATNYWLGDADADGYVDVVADVTALANTYGLATGDGGYDGTCDVGPTDNASPRGIPNPETDGFQVQFEDLMIFALNLGEVDPALKFSPGELPDLQWDRLDENVWALVLRRPCAGLKGVNLQAELPAGVRCQVSPGALLDQQSSPMFVRNATADGLDAGLAAIGFGKTITGSGELLRVALNEPLDRLEATVSARDLDNRELLVAVDDAEDPPSVVPDRHRLGQNYPNPFNPLTTISFALPQAARVHLAIYTVNGRLVRTLLNEERTAGNHSVTWLGRDDAGRSVATGTYFYQLRAGDFRQVRKLTLVK